MNAPLVRNAPAARSRWVRGTMVVLATVAAVALGLVWPALARGEAWRNAKWAAWPGLLGAHPSTADTLAWAARAAWCGAIVLALLAVPYALWRMTLGADARVPRLGLPTLAPLLIGPRGWRTPLRDAPGVLRGAALVLAVLALGRPQSVLRGENLEEKGIDIVLVLDLSGSMAAVMDAPESELVPGVGAKAAHRPTRIDVAKDVLIDFVRRRKTDRIGVVVFAKQAFVLSPPTLDYALIASLVSRIELGVIDSSKTAIGDAVGTAVARMRRSSARSKAVVLLTDGDSNEGVISPEYSAHLAKKEGVRVYTVQIGNGDDVDVQTGTDLFGQPVYARKRFPVNPELLKSMSKETGGEAFIATDKRALESSMHRILDHLEKTKFESEASTMEDLFPFLLLPAVVLLALEALIRLALVRRFP
ncbi:MAG TPA: VWA domain-containing protein [Polyangiaceae bacterium]|nr:VWA domain-containing protein [Polyangiaceae bacterium]